MNVITSRGALCRVMVMYGLALCSSLGSIGCESKPEGRSYPGLSPEESAALPRAPLRPAPSEDTQPTDNALDPENDPLAPAQPGPPDPGSLMAPGGPSGSTGAAGGSTGGDSEKEKRDLSAELKAALGEPIDCLDLSKLPPTGGTITLQVGAYVGPSGRISRASVSAAGQPSSTVACVEKRTLAIKMRDPIDDAPLLVNTTIEFELARAPTPAAPAPTPPPPAPTY